MIGKHKFCNIFVILSQESALLCMHSVCVWVCVQHLFSAVLLYKKIHNNFLKKQNVSFYTGVQCKIFFVVVKEKSAVCLIAQCHINSSTNIRADVLPWCTGLTACPVCSHYLPVAPPPSFTLWKFEKAPVPRHYISCYGNIVFALTTNDMALQSTFLVTMVT